jgi:hypothetical protein
MDEAARAYVRALDDRNALRKNPPHNVFKLQDSVRNYAQRLLDARAAVRAAASARYGPTRSGVMRTTPGGVYAFDTKLMVRRGSDAPALGFWNIESNKTVYLTPRGREWEVRYGPDAGETATLAEHWTPSGLRK